MAWLRIDKLIVAVLVARPFWVARPAIDWGQYFRRKTHV
jgi:hypothetical protein